MAQNVFEKINNSDLSTMSSAELQELFNEAGKTGIQGKMTKAQFNAAMRKVSDAIETAKAKENGQPQPQAAADTPKATDEEKERFAANVGALNSMQYEADADHRKMLNHLLIETEDGKGTNLQEEMIEAAKLRVLVDNAEAEKSLDKDAYKTAVDKEIETILGSMFMASANSNEDVKANGEKWRDLIDKPATVSYKVASGVLGSYLGGSKDKADKLATKYENKNFLAGFTSRLNKVVDSATKKIGKVFKQTWKTVKVMYKQGSLRESLIGAGLAVGSILAAGTVVGAPISAGLAAYSGYIAYNRTKPVVEAYNKEKGINGKDYKFKDFYKAHKRDVWKAGLYTVAGLTGAVAGITGAVAPFVNTASDTAVILNGIHGTAATARMGAIPAAATTPYVVDYFNAETKEDKKKALRNIAIVGGTSALAMGVAAFGAEFIGEASAAEVAPTEGTPSAEAPVAETPEAPVNSENAGDNDWRLPWHQEAEAPADGGTETTDTNVDGYVHQFETRVPTDAEQAFYESRTSLVPNPDAMIANVEGDIVHLPEGMTAEQAIHLAAMDKLYYGDDTALKLLLDCDTVKDVNAEEFFNNLHDKFVTDMNDKLPMGFPTDPNYQADPNIHGKITHVDCDDIKIQRVVDGKVVNVPMENITVHPIEGAPIVENTPIAEETPVIKGHIENAIEIVQDGTAPTGTHPDFTLPGGHATNELDALNQLDGNNSPAQAVTKPKGVTLTDAQIAHALMSGNTK